VKILTIFLLLLASTQLGAFGQQSPAPEPPASGDLQELVGTWQKIVDETIVSKRGEKLSMQLESMRVPEYQSWFPAAFSAANGTKLASIYAESLQKTEGQLVEYFVAHAPPGGQVTASVASGGPEPQKTGFLQGFDNAIRNSLTQPAFFYRLEYSWKQEQTGSPVARRMGYVTLVGGSYRLIGENVLRTLPDMPVARIRMGGKATGAMLANKVQPIYPLEARRQRVSGVVRLHAIIAADGSVEQLETVSGDALLVQAALDAVRQWRYRPTTLDGEAVEVDTTIDVIFALTY
jgi:TonB family protein